jgi:hypothetical protein
VTYASRVLQMKHVPALLDAGLLNKIEDGRIVFPFDAVRVDFTLRAA